MLLTVPHPDIWIARFKPAKTVSPDQKVIIPGEPELIVKQMVFLWLMRLLKI